MNQHGSPSPDASLDAKWIASTSSAVAACVYLLSAFIRRTTIAEEFSVPAEVLGPLIGDRGWAGYAALDTVVVLATLLGGWFIPFHKKLSLWLPLAYILACLGFAIVLLAIGTWMPPATVLGTATLIAVLSAAHSAKLALLGGRLSGLSAALAVAGIGVALLLGWVYVVRALFVADQLAWYIKTRPPVQLRVTEHETLVGSLGGIDPAIDEIRLLGLNGDFVYLYWRGLDDAQYGEGIEFNARQNPRMFAVRVSDVELLSDSAILR